MNPEPLARPKYWRVPGALVAFRGLCGLCLLALAWSGLSGWPFVAVFLLGFVSDIVDGMIARRLGVSSEGVRQADGIVDTLFYIAVLVSAVLVFGGRILPYWPLLATIILLQLTLFGLSWLRFRKLPSCHGWSAKGWGLALAVSTIGLFVAADPRWLWPAFVMGCVNSLEEMAIMSVLPEWKHDVWSIFAALESSKAAKKAG